jgi:branched-chain amino acid aminotransferase
MTVFDPSEYIVRIDGRVVDPRDASVSVFDHGFLFGDSIYEVVRTAAGKLFALEEHLARLRNSARRLSMSIPWTDEELRGEVEAIVGSATWSGDTYVRIFVTRGVGRIDLMPTTCERPCLILVARKLVEPPPDFYEKGIVLCLTDVRRNSRLAMDPAIKSGNYLNNVLAVIEAKIKGADDAIMLNENGHLTEATTSNLFLVKDGALRTPSLDCGILEGITRAKLLELARALGIPAEECELGPDDLTAADEIFISGTIKGVVPARKVVGGAEWVGAPGDVTARLSMALKALMGLGANAV